MTRARTILIAALTVCGVALAGAGTASAAADMPVVGKPITAFDRATVLDASTCDSSSAHGDFCGWRHTSFAGGLYRYSGDDTNLWNDRFERQDTNVVVAKQISSVLNDGATVTGFDDVILLDGAGHSLCLPRLHYVLNLGAWNDRITGYRWGNCYP